MIDNNNTDEKRIIRPADRIVALRLWLHRQLDRLYDEACDKEFTGNVALTISAKDGRPGEPKLLVERYGVSEF
jgi:hypothetical protein